MFELGSYANRSHRILSKQINKTNINEVYVYGTYVKKTYNGLILKKRGRILNRLNHIKEIFEKDISNNDVVMIKGSNASGLFKICQNLKKGRLNVI